MNKLPNMMSPKIMEWRFEMRRLVKPYHLQEITDDIKRSLDIRHGLPVDDPAPSFPLE